MDSFTSDHENKPTKHHQPSSSDLLSSAKLMAQAGKAALNHETDKIDRARVAGAAEDLLSAASHYGKLEEKSFGKYVEKAENYLHQYHSSHSTTTSSTVAHHSADAGGKTHPPAHSSAGGGGEDGNSASGHGESASGYGDYLKMAQGFLGSHSSGGESGDGGHSGSGGYAEYLKMAEGFLKKH